MSQVLGQANPKKTASARFTASIVSSSRCPITAPSLSREMDCGLSTITCDGLIRPFRSFEFTAMRNSGASRNSLVTGKMVTEGWLSNRSDWITKAGRGLPRSPCKATVTRSPRLIANLRYRLRPQATRQFRARAHLLAMIATDGGILRQSPRAVYPAPISVLGASRIRATRCDAFVLVRMLLCPWKPPLF